MCNWEKYPIFYKKKCDFSILKFILIFSHIYGTLITENIVIWKEMGLAQIYMQNMFKRLSAIAQEL